MKKFKIFFAVLLAFTTLFSLGITQAFAEENNLHKAIATDIYLPGSYLEYFELNAPTDVYYDEEVSAILEGGSNAPRLIVYKDQTYITFTKEDFDEKYFKDISQIKRLGDYLILQDDLRICAFSLADNTYEQLSDVNGEQLVGKYFSTNGNFFITLSTTNINVYTVSLTNDLKPVLTPFGIIETGGTSISVNRIAINGNDEIFYFSSTGLCKKDLKDLSKEPVTYGTVPSPTGMIANNEYIYLSSSAGIEKISITEKDKHTIKLTTSNPETLSDLATPMEMAFKDNNILVADETLGKVIELTTDNDALFTGFAITTVGVADNRLTANTQDISVSGDKVAVLNGDSFTLTDGVSYTSYPIDFSPKHIALGSGSVALMDNDTFRVFDLESGDINSLSLGNYLKSLAYSNGHYYVSTLDTILVINEKTLEKEKTVEVTFGETNLITVDVDKNVYLYNNGTVKIYNGKNDYNLETLTFELKNTPKKLGVDLNGNVYSLTQNNVIEYVKNNTVKTAEIQLSENLPNATATSFAMNFDNGKIFFLFNGNGFIATTSFAENDSITDVLIPNDFKLTDQTAKGLDELEIYKIKENSNVYEILYESDKETFSYKQILSADTQDYVLAGTTYAKTSQNSGVFKILIGETKTVLVKENDCKNRQMQTTSPINKGYLGTKFSLYYYPVLTPNGEYALTQTVLLKNTPIEIKGLVTVNGRDFYYASYNEVSGYILKNAVVEKLSELFERDDYSYKTINGSKTAVNIFADETLETVKITVNEKISVTAIKITDEVYYVTGLLSDNTEISGYVLAENFVKNGKNAVRNTLIIVLVALSVSATSIFFVWRKRK